MIRKSKECIVEEREHMRDGQGTVKLTHFVNKDELYQKGRLFSKITLDPGCSIGWHVHEKDSEIFYIETGHPTYNDNGIEKETCPGDILICPVGTGHGIANNTNDTVNLIAIIIYA